VESWIRRRNLTLVSWGVAGGLIGEHLGYRVAWGAAAVVLFSLVSCRVTAVTTAALGADLRDGVDEVRLPGSDVTGVDTSPKTFGTQHAYRPSLA
jgi:hypothetical protein